MNSNSYNDNVEALNEIHKGLVMGMESIAVVSDEIGDSDFRNVLQEQYKQYGELLNRTNNAGKQYNIELKDTNIMQKMMGWTTIKMETIKDKSNSKISDMLIQGTTMGISQGRKWLNKSENLDKEVSTILKDFVTKQEKDIETLKKYL